MLHRFGLDFSGSSAYLLVCWFLTFCAWVFSMVFFRAPTLEQGWQICSAMLGMSGFEVPAGILVRAGAAGDWALALGATAVQGGGAVLLNNFLWLVAVAPIAFYMPNVAQIFHRYDPVLYENEKIFSGKRQAGFLSWDYNTGWAIAVSVAGVAGIMTLQQVSEFLYFQF